MKIKSSDEFIGKKVNVKGDDLELENVELVSIEENGVVVHDASEGNGGINYWIPKNAIKSIDDDVSGE